MIERLQVVETKSVWIVRKKLVFMLKDRLMKIGVVKKNRNGVDVITLEFLRR